MKLAKRVQQLAPSVTLAAAARAKALQAAGKDVINLTVGEPDFVTPQNIQHAAIQAIQSGKASYYTPTAGIPELQQAIIDYTYKYYQQSYQKSNVIVTDGAKFALYLLFQAILNPHDEVLIPSPYWVSYGEQVKLAQGKPVFIQGTSQQAFKITVEQLEKERTAKTKLLILNSPSNPTGMIYSKAELTAIGNWAVKHNIFIVSDEIYGRLVYNNNAFTPIATISEAIRKNTLIISGVSKTYAMTGWRIGYALGDETIIEAMRRIASQSTSNPTTNSQYAAIEALSGEQMMVENMRKTFEERLNHIFPKVAALPGFQLMKPQGAFYLFPNIKETLVMCGYTDSDTWTKDLLEEAHVALVTGSGFGAPDHIRLSYAADLASLEEAIQRIAKFIKKKMIS